MCVYSFKNDGGREKKQRGVQKKEKEKNEKKERNKPRTMIRKVGRNILIEFNSISVKYFFFAEQKIGCKRGWKIRDMKKNKQTG